LETFTSCNERRYSTLRLADLAARRTLAIAGADDGVSSPVYLVLRLVHLIDRGGELVLRFQQLDACLVRKLGHHDVRHAAAIAVAGGDGQERQYEQSRSH
jgi:hypothetical protein